MNPATRITLASLVLFGASQRVAIAEPPQPAADSPRSIVSDSFIDSLMKSERDWTIKPQAGWSQPVPPLMLSVPIEGEELRYLVDKVEQARARSSGTRYCIRVYTYDGYGKPSVSSNPNILADGVIGYNTLLIVDPPASPPPTPKPAEKPEAKPTPPTPTPTLDELLGIKPKPKPKPGDPTKPDETPPAHPTDPTAPDQSKTDLDRLLTAQEMGDALKQAITLMGDAASRLTEHKDPGLGTQRVQEDVVKRLDQLLASLDKQQSQGSPQPQPNPKPGDPKQNPGPKKPSPGTPQPQPNGDGMQDHAGPTLQTGQLKPELESARAAWGSLPARVRDMLMQGTEDRFSNRYKAMTQEYYKRLAEENHK